MNRIVPLLLILLLFSGCVTIQKTSEKRCRFRSKTEFEGSYYMSDTLDEGVKILTSITPSLSSNWRDLSTLGWANVELLVDEEGKPSQIQVSKATDLLVAQAAVRCISKWTFSPGLKGGNPVKSLFNIELDFSSRMNRLKAMNRVKHKDTPTFTPAMFQDPRW